MDARSRLRHQLEAALVDAFTGRKPSIPEAGQLIWRWFTDLSLRRSWHAAGPNPIGYSDLQAYCQLRQWPMRPQDVDSVLRLDDGYLRLYSERQARERGDIKTMPQGSGQAVNPAAFDAVFG